MSLSFRQQGEPGNLTRNTVVIYKFVVMPICNLPANKTHNNKQKDMDFDIDAQNLLLFLYLKINIIRLF